MRRHQGRPARADLLLPGFPGSGGLPGGRGRRAAGRAAGRLGRHGAAALPAAQLRGAGADPGLGAVAAGHRRGPVPTPAHPAQVGRAG